MLSMHGWLPVGNDRRYPARPGMIVSITEMPDESEFPGRVVYVVRPVINVVFRRLLLDEYLHDHVKMLSSLELLALEVDLPSPQHD